MARFFGLSRNRSDADTQRFIERKRRELERRERKLRERSTGRVRKTTSAKTVSGFSKRERETYDRVIAAVHYSRTKEIPLRVAVKHKHTTLRSVRLYAGSAIDREHRQLVVKGTDTLVRRMNVVTKDGVVPLYVRGSRQASLAAKHFILSVKYSEGKARPEDFRRFQGKTVSGRPLETNPDRAALAVRDAGVDYDDVYQDKRAA